ncbi:MAG: Ig-like domain-containing protein [Deltaproteobacteria bacterium]|nr:MAG: Ig-like domain-containing protein [Deltaproteobacteria bacterium]
MIYNTDGLLETTVTVALVDSRGAPVSSILVMLSSSRTGPDTILEDQGVTSDASGEAVFHVTSDTFGD